MKKESLQALLDKYNETKQIPFEELLLEVDIEEEDFEALESKLLELGYTIKDEEASVITGLEPEAVARPDKLDSYSLFMKDVLTYKLLTKEEEFELSKKIIEGASYVGKNNLTTEEQALLEAGYEAREKLIIHNLRLVVAISKRYQGQLDQMDLISEGALGLMRAAERYDYTTGNRFSTYATWWIKQAMSRAIAKYARTIKIPIHLVEKLNKLYRTTIRLQTKLNKEPTIEEIAKALKVSVSEVESLQSLSTSIISLNQEIGDEGDTTLQDFIASDLDTPEEAFIKSKKVEQLDALLKTLPDRDEQIVRYRFGLKDGKIYTYEEIGELFDLTRERIRQIIKTSLVAMRKNNKTFEKKDVI